MRNIKNNHFVPARENELRERIPVPHVWLAVCSKIQENNIFIQGSWVTLDVRDFWPCDASLSRSGWCLWLVVPRGKLIKPIRSTTQIWVVTCHQYGIPALVSQTSFGGETSGSIAKCRLFSQAMLMYGGRELPFEKSTFWRNYFLFFIIFFICYYFPLSF